MDLPKGTKLTGNGLNLVLRDCHPVTEPGSFAEDIWEYEWIKVCGGSHITTDCELAALLSDGAKIGGCVE